MRAAVRQKWASLLAISGSSSSTATPESHRTDDSYCSRGTGSTHSTDDDTHTSATSSSSEMSSSGTSSASSAAKTHNSTSTSSAASSSSSGISSSNTSGASSTKRAPSSLASSSDALTKTSANKDRSKAAAANRAASELSPSASTTSTSNGVAIDDADALVQLPSSPSPQQYLRGSANAAQTSAVSSFPSQHLACRAGGAGNPQQPGVASLQLHGSRSVDPASPASPYHFSEEELARQPWVIECDATTHTSEEGGLVTRAVDVLETIHTTPIAVPPPPEEAARRRREGGLPYPSHLTFRIIPQTAGGADADGAAAADGAARRDKEGKTALTGDRATTGAGGRVQKTACDSCCGGHLYRKREEAQRKAEERAAARQKSYHNQLRSHHVPLVNFRTTRDPAVNLIDADTTLPTVEEAAGYRHYEEDLQGAEANPKKLEKAMRQRRRPASGLHWKTKYAFGRRAGGGPRGVGESAFAREGDPQRFWIAQLHERSQVHLEMIETE
ncbi:hypothetical protein ABB37_01906 [Leptomonas pyrrhocoris]|uniref:Uncharacterized protein n=1 Tax=Leptomonas pyrrhocoris TaxID=157538 RepID=A0A0N0VGU1_LEPPY|nr:hypothetical protein ABB37_01906 [Leptomonas pyrrhocoris]KPA83638.1 hypothetical protein ABB37_01906 [Leptomonas pyrrhocoris]|eukprot:XP_015662077.1 hypothetical protein ABB37_01906 [Leptomonas pyrrhocoris]